jgi:hypothetical protein
MTTQPTALDLDAIEARANAATDGPWRLSEDYNDIHASDGDHLASYWHTADGAFIAHARTDVPALLAEVRHLTARQLTESEYSSAWHAVEGAAGEDGADPGTILHAVLNRLGIALPDTPARP